MLFTMDDLLSRKVSSPCHNTFPYPLPSIQSEKDYLIANLGGSICSFLLMENELKQWLLLVQDSSDFLATSRQLSYFVGSLVPELVEKRVSDVALILVFLTLE